jgi:DNA mismatch endonuclease (patch repair protein)
MQANGRVSAREVAFRRALWKNGARGYRVQSRMAGRPDLAFPALKVAVFVHGCFWHGCRACALPAPKANAEFWRAKLEANRERDRAVDLLLHTNGWKTVTVWEHEIRPDPEPRARSLAHWLAQRRAVLPTGE